MRAVELINGWVLPVAAAPLIGSFCGVLIARLPRGQSVVSGRSACPACGHALGPPDLVPILSFAALRGACRYCRAPIARFHLAVELACVAVAIWAATTGADGALLWCSCALGWALLTLGWIDAASLRLPDALTLPLLAAGLAEAAWLEPEALTGRAFGAALGYTALWAVAQGYRRLRGRAGLGLGDAKLLAAGGAWVGAAALPLVVLGAALGGLAWALRRGRPDWQARQPFGPFLAAAIWVAWLYS